LHTASWKWWPWPSIYRDWNWWGSSCPSVKVWYSCFVLNTSTSLMSRYQIYHYWSLIGCDVTLDKRICEVWFLDINLCCVYSNYIKHVGFTSIKLSHAMVSRYMNKCLKWHGDIPTVKSVGIFHTIELSPGQIYGWLTNCMKTQYFVMFYIVMNVWSIV
jgi:hypothetical protein